MVEQGLVSAEPEAICHGLWLVCSEVTVPSTRNPESYFKKTWRRGSLLPCGPSLIVAVSILPLSPSYSSLSHYTDTCTCVLVLRTPGPRDRLLPCIAAVAVYKYKEQQQQQQQPSIDSDSCESASYSFTFNGWWSWSSTMIFRSLTWRELDRVQARPVWRSPLNR